MKKLFTYLTFFLNIIVATAQPAGKLYTHIQSSTGMGRGSIGYIDYPSGNYIHIDSTNAYNILIDGDSLYIADGVVRIIDLTTNTMVDTINTSNLFQLVKWNGQLIATAQQPPYFRVYDNATHTLLYSIDDTKITTPPFDMHLSDDRVFLLSGDSITVVDLLLQDTITKFFTPHPFPFAGSNTHIVERNNMLYVVVNYATGAARFSLLAVDKNNYTVSTAFHYEGAESSSKPVVAGDSIYMFVFDSHYNIPQDSFYVANNMYIIPVSYDSISRSIFVVNFQNNSMVYYINGVASTQVQLPGYLNKTAFKSDVSTTVEENDTKFLFNVYPNPASNHADVNFNSPTYIQSINIVDNNGRCARSIKVNAVLDHTPVDLSGFPTGVYTIELVTGEKTFRHAIVVNR
jgi:hypothetical protein